MRSCARSSLSQFVTEINSLESACAILSSPAPRSAYPLPQVPDIFSSEALAFLRNLTLRFSRSLRTLLARREAAQAGYDRGARPGFLAETTHVRAGAWSRGGAAGGALDRRVEISWPARTRAGRRRPGQRGPGPMAADFEDSLAPTLDNLVLGQQTLYLAVRGQLRQRPGTEDRPRRRADGPAPGPAPPGAAPGSGGAAGAGLPVRRRPVPVPQRPGAVRAGRQAVPLACPSWSTTWKPAGGTWCWKPSSATWTCPPTASAPP